MGEERRYTCVNDGSCHPRHHSALVATEALLVAGAATAASGNLHVVEGNITVGGGGNNKSCADDVTGDHTAVGTGALVVDGRYVLDGTTPNSMLFTSTITQTVKLHRLQHLRLEWFLLQRSKAE